MAERQRLQGPVHRQRTVCVHLYVCSRCLYVCSRTMPVLFTRGLISNTVPTQLSKRVVVHRVAPAPPAAVRVFFLQAASGQRAWRRIRPQKLHIGARELPHALLPTSRAVCAALSGAATTHTSVKKCRSTGSPTTRQPFSKPASSFLTPSRSRAAPIMGC